MPTSSFAKPSKIYPNLYFWFENTPSGNPVSAIGSHCSVFDEENLVGRLDKCTLPGSLFCTQKLTKKYPSKCTMDIF
jgi:hypothetical protein